MSDARQAVNAALDEKLTIETLHKFLNRMFDVEHEYGLTCPRCKHGFKSKFPAIDKQARALEILLNQGKGAPKQTVEMAIPQALAEIAEATDEALASWIAAGEQKG